MIVIKVVQISIIFDNTWDKKPIEWGIFVISNWIWMKESYLLL